MLSPHYIDLLQQTDHPQVKGRRTDKLQALLDSLNWEHLDDEQRSALFEVLHKYNSLFILHSSELGIIKAPPAKITVADPRPVRGPMYRYPEKAKELISELIRDMEENEVIEPSTAAWLSAIVLVNKPDGSKRLCLDYRGVNTHLAQDVYPLPRLQELVKLASGSKYYATIALKEAY